ncbi:hypothetical protein U27_03175 [Candidatus Vecturithrix granuli]|uniref:Uncharacterized protein n=1 Tax=Vecturithrix granuli TaxID=1499967 RepID=A0A081BV58_VECG1|nr:hypothetical protein U27_03175 [Candidatus Vecturithrix granuli]
MPTPPYVHQRLVLACLLERMACHVMVHRTEKFAKNDKTLFLEYPLYAHNTREHSILPDMAQFDILANR